PDVVAALTDLLDELVAVHGPVFEQQQDGSAHVTAPAPSAATPAATEALPETRAEPGTEARPELGSVAVPSTAAELPPVGTEFRVAGSTTATEVSEFSLFLVTHNCLLRHCRCS